MASIALAPGLAVTRAFSGAIKWATRSVRWTIVVSSVLIFGSFVSAAIIQMRLDRMHAINQARAIETQRADAIASDLSVTFDRFAALGTAFANAKVSAETSAALSEVGGPALRNIAVLDGRGHLQSEMKQPPADLLPLANRTLAQAQHGHAVFPTTDGAFLVLAFPIRERIVLVEVVPGRLLPGAMPDDAIISTVDGWPFLVGRTWRVAPAQTNLSDSRQRLIARSPVSGWPVTVATSLPVNDALVSWFGALPLYFFFILGPAFVGASLAVVFVREIERRARATDVVRRLKSRNNEEAKLLIRLADTERRAVEAERSRSEFIMHMSHDLRTPLNAIIGFSEIIAKGLFGAAGHPKYREYAGDICEAGRSLHAKIEAVLDFANLESGRQPIKLAQIDIAGISREVVESIAGRAFSRKIHLAARIPETAAAVGDALALKRTLTNVLDNALRYTPEGGNVRVEVRTEDLFAIVSVRDDGFGFTAMEAGRAGTPFTRFDRAGTVTGTGLGLAIASALVRRMGGRLRISGKPVEGAAIEIRLRRTFS